MSGVKRQILHTKSRLTLNMRPFLCPEKLCAEPEIHFMHDRLLSPFLAY